MQRRVYALLAVVVALTAPAPAALASGPSVLASPPATSADRYRPQVVFEYTTPVSLTDPATQVSFHRVGGTAQVPVTVTGSGTTTITLQVDATLAYGSSYFASITLDDSTFDTVTWATRAAPAHPTLRVKIITALAPDAVDDIVRRLDRANLLAVPHVGDLVDISAATGRTLASADLTGYHAALVVTDKDVTGQLAAGGVLANFAAAGHGVVLGGQTHWTTGTTWTALSAIGAATGGWATKWSPLGYAPPATVIGGVLRPASVQPHFLTKYLTSLTVIGAGSGSEATQQGWNESVLATLLAQPGAGYSNGQSLLAIHWDTGDQPGRVVDLGFNPWSSDVPSGGGGFDPVASPQAGPLITRALWWSMNRIPPTHTHSTSKPPNPSPFATVSFSLAGADADPASQFTTMRYQYKVGVGPWHWASGGTSFALYHLTPGKTYTVRARAVDSGGNKDLKAAVYTFRLSPGAYG
ncbi:MAG: hypothetical protein QOJ31_1350 [Gaiellales bacterium]|nr:hypothetical protein [Gaiellales bacterium]